MIMYTFSFKFSRISKKKIRMSIDIAENFSTFLLFHINLQKMILFFDQKKIQSFEVDGL